jgi:hypothetical protein
MNELTGISILSFPVGLSIHPFATFRSARLTRKAAVFSRLWRVYHGKRDLCLLQTSGSASRIISTTSMRAPSASPASSVVFLSANPGYPVATGRGNPAYHRPN